MYIFVRNNGADNKIIVSRSGTDFIGKGTFLNEVGQSGNRKITLRAAIAGIDIFQTTKINRSDRKRIVRMYGLGNQLFRLCDQTAVIVKTGQ